MEQGANNRFLRMFENRFCGQHRKVCQQVNMELCLAIWTNKFVALRKKMFTIYTRLVLPALENSKEGVAVSRNLWSATRTYYPVCWKVWKCLFLSVRACWPVGLVDELTLATCSQCFPHTLVSTLVFDWMPAVMSKTCISSAKFTWHWHMSNQLPSIAIPTTRRTWEPTPLADHHGPLDTPLERVRWITHKSPGHAANHQSVLEVFRRDQQTCCEACALGAKHAADLKNTSLQTETMKHLVSRNCWRFLKVLGIQNLCFGVIWKDMSSDECLDISGSGMHGS